MEVERSIASSSYMIVKPEWRILDSAEVVRNPAKENKGPDPSLGLDHGSEEREVTKSSNESPGWCN